MDCVFVVIVDYEEGEVLSQASEAHQDWNPRLHGVPIAALLAVGGNVTIELN